MARMARTVIPHLPHHVTQRGNGRAQTFFTANDHRYYLNLLSKHCREAGVAVWSWVLMPNHVHMILTPEDRGGITRAMARVHRAYAGYIHARLDRTGHFWQGRFGCVAMDEAHLHAAVRYIVLNPVRAGLAKRAQDWRWSSVHAHLGKTEDIKVTDRRPVAARIDDFKAYLKAGEDELLSMALRRSETIGRPLGDVEFMRRLEQQTGRSLKPKKRGPKPERT